MVLIKSYLGLTEVFTGQRSLDLYIQNPGSLSSIWIRGFAEGETHGSTRESKWCVLGFYILVTSNIIPGQLQSGEMSFPSGLSGPSSGLPHNYIQYLDPSSICQSLSATPKYLEPRQYDLEGCSTHWLFLLSVNILNGHMGLK